MSIYDAFGSGPSHPYASTEGDAGFLYSSAGLFMEKELRALTTALSAAGAPILCH